MVELVTNQIEPQRVLSSVASPHAGAVVLFLGTTREFTGDRQTNSLDYECYPAMARRKLEELEAEARSRWPIVGCAIVHRVGHLEIGEASVAIAVSSAHRRTAFEAGQWLIDLLKEVVPIWKRENWSDGTSQWVHPGLSK
jgi:molybdopterin synthase catalytic subunit